MTIVVGIDSTEASRVALDWAAARVGRFGPILPVHAWDYPISAWLPSPLGPGAAPPSEAMHEAARDAAERILGDLGDDVAREPAIITQGDAGVTLLEAAQDADLLVVGTRGRGPVRANTIGSVTRHCADNTPCPLVIVPTREDDAGHQTEQVVVGIDGSEGSITALRWAIENTPTSATITAMTAWQTPIDGPILYGVNRFDLRALRAAAEATVNEAADKVCAELKIDPTRVNREIAEGDARWVLLSRSDECDLLVLGQRGRTGLSHFFLGSTTTALIHQPHCPIAVIPG